MSEYIKDRSQVYDPVTKMWVKLNTKIGEGGIVGYKKDGKPYKNVRIAKKKKIKIEKLMCDKTTINKITKRILDIVDEKKVMRKIIKDALRNVSLQQADKIKKELDKKEKIKIKPGCVEFRIGKERFYR